MGYLDNLENSLKSLENSGSERENLGREQARRKADRLYQAAIAPWADRLKASPFTRDLLSAATRDGHRLRTKVYIAWAGQVLRLDARDRRLELRPTPEGILAVFLRENKEAESRLIDLAGDPASLVQDWLRGVEITPTTPLPEDL